MKKISLALLVILLLTSPLSAQIADCPRPSGGRPIAHSFETLTVSTTALPLTQATIFTAAAISTPYFAVITVETQPIRFKYDGVAAAPTAAIGHLRAAGAEIPLCGTDTLRSFRIIRQGGVDASITVTVFR